MAYIKVDINKLGQLESQLNRIPSVINSTASKVRSVRSGLDWDVACEAGIDSTLRRIASELDASKRRMEKTVSFVDSAVQQYSKAEYGKVTFGSITYSATGNVTIKNSVENTEEAQKKRQKTATALKWFVGIGCAVASIAAIAITGGAATPLVMAGISAASSAIIAANNHLADEYVEKGTIAYTDWGEFGKDVLVGGCVGWVTGVVGGAVGGAVTSKLGSTALQSGLYSTNTGIRVATNAVIGGVSEISSGIVTRGTESIITGAVEGDIDIGEVANKTFNPVNIVYDAALGGFAGGLQGRKEASFVDGMSKEDAARYVDSNGFDSAMSDADAARYLQRLSGNYNTYNTELVVADPSYINTNAFDTENYSKVNWNKYAKNGGVVEGSVIENQTLMQGTIISRYGDGNGKYVSPDGTSFAERSLPYVENPQALHKYKVLKNISGVTTSEIAPAFGQPGGGIQNQLPESVYDLMFKGYLVEVAE